MTSQYHNFKIVEIDDRPNIIFVKFEYKQKYVDLIFIKQYYIYKYLLNTYIKSNRTNKLKLIRCL